MLYEIAVHVHLVVYWFVLVIQFSRLVGQSLLTTVFVHALIYKRLVTLNYLALSSCNLAAS